MANIPPPDSGQAVKTTTSTTPGVLGFPSNKQVFLWGISALTLIAIAEPYPNFAIGMTWILIIGVLLMNANDYITLLNAAFGGKK